MPEITFTNTFKSRLLFRNDHNETGLLVGKGDYDSIQIYSLEKKIFNKQFKLQPPIKYNDIASNPNGTSERVPGSIKSNARDNTLVLNFDDDFNNLLSYTLSSEHSGGARKVANNITYTKTARKHTDKKGVTRVVYVKGGKSYVKVKNPKTGKFGYRAIKV